MRSLHWRCWSGIPGEARVGTAWPWLKTLVWPSSVRLGWSLDQGVADRQPACDQHGRCRPVATRDDLQDWVVEALRTAGGEAHLVEVTRTVWQTHRGDLEASGDLFYTWQYDLRWAATKLRHKGLLDTAERTGRWRLSAKAMEV